MQLPVEIDSVKGFLAPEEGKALYERCKQAAKLGPCLEVGSYCGKSTVYLGVAARETGSTVFALDHHRGSEEHQPGEAYHDAELFDAGAGLMDSFREFRRTMRRAELEDHVVPLVAPSAVVGRNWKTPLGMVFIDGGHSLEAAITDYETWSPHVVPGGFLVIHDIFPDPNDGGQAPYTIWKKAQESGLFEDVGIINTLGVLTRKDC